jgi:hypothetical protein
MHIRTFVAALIVLPLAAFTAPSAQSPNPKFKAEIDRLDKWTEKNRADRGIKVTGEGDAEALTIDPFKAIKLRILKVAPGGTVAVSVPGEYPANTAILSERDGVTLSVPAMSSSSYSARMTVAADELPGFARLAAVAPISWRAAFKAVALVEAVYRLELHSADGITARVTPLERTFTIDEPQMNAKVKYQADFFRSGETKPFNTVTGFQSFSIGDEPSSHFDIGLGQDAASPQAQLDEINKQMSDPGTTEAKRNELMQKMADVQKKMMEDMMKGLKSDPADLDRKQKDFGCGDLTITTIDKAAGTVSGFFHCGENFHDGILKVTGTMTMVR